MNRKILVVPLLLLVSCTTSPEEPQPPVATSYEERPPAPEPSIPASDQEAFRAAVILSLEENTPRELAEVCDLWSLGDENDSLREIMLLEMENGYDSKGGEDVTGVPFYSEIAAEVLDEFCE